MLPYSGGIFMLVGVIAFDLSVNVIDRWRMNKIQQRALEAAKIEQKLQEARLELALHQIKPHFLQNALPDASERGRTGGLRFCRIFAGKYECTGICRDDSVSGRM